MAPDAADQVLNVCWSPIANRSLPPVSTPAFLGPTMAWLDLPNTHKLCVLTNLGMTAVCLTRPGCQRFRRGQSGKAVLETTISHIEATRPQLCGHRSPSGIPRFRVKQGKASRGDIEYYIVVLSSMTSLTIPGYTVAG